MGKRKRDRKPVLTSPWKIGTLVALMLIATSFGVGYYMVKVYSIDLYWLSSDVNEWVVDSYQFFREIYPAAAGVVIIALFTYFVIASAVRRYKYYLNSGQDYRKMISIADSIDDLTNPAQIARLSEYPELQEVLRNYGDQIREISEGMETREEEMRSVDLEVEIDSILQGKGMNETLAEGKWWVAIAKKVQVWVEENAGGKEEVNKQSEASRQAAGRASLSCGKVIETVAGVNEDILDIVRSVGQLNAVADGLGSGGSGETIDTGSNSEAVSTMETAAAALEERGTAIHGLSEENNGLALNMALMAARGEVTEKDLAQLAEKVRSSAERFGKLGKELEGLARTIIDNSRAVGSVSGSVGISPEAGRGVIEISEKIESRSRALQQKMISMGNDIDEISNVLQSGHEEPAEERIRATDGSIVNFGAESEESKDEPVGIDDSDLVIDHGKLWDGPEEVPADEPVVEEVEQVEEEPSISAEETVEESNDVVGEIFADESVADDNWADMQVKADERVEVQPEPEIESAPVDELPTVEPEIVQEPQTHEPAGLVEETVPETDEEPVYDLFELGAVEYMEETEVNL
ncbi:MAG: hypothetical protein KAU49_02425 [Candidatus Krumholzibacteria bacterium]|nr:hypothetical protein [Candidatus Krumholzibacteria bacterium]